MNLCRDCRQDCSIGRRRHGHAQKQTQTQQGSHVLPHKLHGALMKSANDACVALAEYMAGTEKNFVQNMNLQACYGNQTLSCFIGGAGLHTDGARIFPQQTVGIAHQKLPSVLPVHHILLLLDNGGKVGCPCSWKQRIPAVRYTTKKQVAGGCRHEADCCPILSIKAFN